MRAFSDMGEAGNLRADLEFAGRMVGTVPPRLLRGLRGALAPAMVAGLACAAAGNLRGQVELRTGQLPHSLTVGLDQP